MRALCPAIHRRCRSSPNRRVAAQLPPPNFTLDLYGQFRSELDLLHWNLALDALDLLNPSQMIHLECLISIDVRGNDSEQEVGYTFSSTADSVGPNETPHE